MKKISEVSSPELKKQISVIEEMVDFTARLVCLKNNQPIGGGSGILVYHNTRIFLFSVLHIFEKDGWYLETDLIENNRTLSVKVPPMNWLTQVPLPLSEVGSLELVDGFAWSEFNKGKLVDECKRLNQEIELPMYEGPIDLAPSTSQVYRFGANVVRRLIKHPHVNELEKEAVIELGMKYDSTDVRGFLCFKLTGKHKGHDFYRGASGSPILDSNGGIVALVQGGSDEENLIYGVPISRFASIAVR